MSNGEDSAFWNQVLERFTAAKLQNAQLTTELKQVKEERDRYRTELERKTKEEEEVVVLLKPEPVQQQCLGQHASAEGQHQDCVDARKLLELEDGISKAQDSYRKIEQKLRDNASMIQDLLDNNQRVRAERDAMQIQRDESKEALRQVQSELEKVRLERQVLSRQLQPIFSSPSTSRNITEGALRLEIQDVYQPKVASLEQEIEQLRGANRKLRDERDVFKDELESVRSKLDRVKLSKSSLHDQLRDLGELARGGLRSRTSSIRISGSQAGGPSSPQSTLSSVLHSAPKPLLSLPEIASELTAEDKASEDNTPTPRPPSSPVFPLPASRQRAISQFALVHPSIALKDNENAFSRDFMTKVLGGSIQPLIVRVSNQGKISKKRDLNGYLCPGLDHNPWCPSIPGQHGYIFVGLGREKDTFRVPEEHNVFVGMKKQSKETRRFRYLGKYQAKKVDPLSRNEWLSLPATMKATYAKTTKEKTKDTRSVEAIHKAYDDGELLVPCVQLQCIGFDVELYQAMVAEYAKVGSTRKEKSSSSGSNKRALEYDADDDSAPRTSKRIALRAS